MEPFVQFEPQDARKKLQRPYIYQNLRQLQLDRCGWRSMAKSRTTGTSDRGKNTRQSQNQSTIDVATPPHESVSQARQWEWRQETIYVLFSVMDLFEESKMEPEAWIADSGALGTRTLQGVKQKLQQYVYRNRKCIGRKIFSLYWNTAEKRQIKIMGPPLPLKTVIWESPPSL